MNTPASWSYLGDSGRLERRNAGGDDILSYCSVYAKAAAPRRATLPLVLFSGNRPSSFQARR